MLTWLRVLIETVNREVAKRRAADARFNAALAFNKLYTYTVGEPRWMCPTCNTVHKNSSYSVFDGLHYPACCEFGEGNRLDRRHATGR